MSLTSRAYAAQTQRVTHTADGIWGQVVFGLLLLITLIGAMVWMNLHDHFTAIYVTSLVAVFTFVVLYASPKPTFFSAIGGMVFDAFNDRDISQSATVGIEFWLRYLVGGTALWFMVASGFLGSWSFKENPEAILPILFGMLVIAMTYGVWKVALGHSVRRLIMFYAIGVILLGLWSTFDPTTRDKMTQATPFGLGEYVNCLADTKVKTCGAEEHAKQTPTIYSGKPQVGTNDVRPESIPEVAVKFVVRGNQSYTVQSDECSTYFPGDMPFKATSLGGGKAKLTFLSTPENVIDVYRWNREDAPCN